MTIDYRTGGVVVIAFVLHTKGPKFDPWSVHFSPKLFSLTPARLLLKFAHYQCSSRPVKLDLIDGVISEALQTWENTCAVIRV